MPAKPQSPVIDPKVDSKIEAKTPLTYRDAGVDMDEGEALVDDIKGLVQRTMRKEVLAGVGGFGALVRIPAGYQQPVLVSGTDGVGTKLRLGIDTGVVEGLGIDLVAMCVNDVLVSGAEPLYFLDYYATGKLDKAVAGQVIRGIAEGCLQAGAALVGGETAEMPGMYHDGDFDLAGFCTAVVEESEIITGEHIAAGHVLLGLKSSGPHSNGYSLIRKIIARSGVDLAAAFDGATYLDRLIAPTRIYVKTVLALLKAGLPVHGMAHITGGGITDNLPRMFPAGLVAEVKLQSWMRPAIFDWLADEGQVPAPEMLRTFNCGIGFVLVVPASAASDVTEALQNRGEEVIALGQVVAGEVGVEAFVRYV